MINLVKFEVSDNCALNQFEIKNIREMVDYNIQIINKGLEKGYDFYSSSYIQSYYSELVGMKYICSVVGISTKVEIEEV